MSDLNDDLIVKLRRHGDLGLDLCHDPENACCAEERLHRSSWRWRGRRRWAVPVVVTATLTVATAAAATALWSPTLGDEQRGRPTPSAADVPADQLRRFGVLRRPVGAADRDATTERALRYLDRRFDGVRVQRIRAVDQDGRRLLIVPVERAGDGRRDLLCLYAVDIEGGGIGCWTTAQIARGRAVLLALPPARAESPRSVRNPEALRPDPGAGVALGLAPDGVDRVAVNGATGRVTDNVYVLPAWALNDPPATWVDEDGEEVPKG
jgi:hypothetical protein